MKTFKVIWVIILLIVSIWSFLIAYKSYKIQSEFWSFEGSSSSWWNLAKWIIIESLTWSEIVSENPTDFDKYYAFKQSWNSRSFYPWYQWTLKGGYTSNSELMNKYLTKNTFQFSLPTWVKNWYLYIKLKKTTNSSVFLYWYWSKKNWYTVSGDLDKDKSLINSETELLYKLDDIPYIRFYDKKSDTYDWLSQMKFWTNNNFIAWFVRDYDWSNKIEEMTIAWE